MEVPRKRHLFEFRKAVLTSGFTVLSASSGLLVPTSSSIWHWRREGLVYVHHIRSEACRQGQPLPSAPCDRHPRVHLQSAPHRYLLLH